MLIGFNNDVEFQGQMYHIQTEDHGIKDGHITTILFFSGQILDSKKIGYAADIQGVTDEEECKKIIKKRMVTLHREFYKRLFDGIYEEQVKKLSASKSFMGKESEPAVAPPVNEIAEAKPEKIERRPADTIRDLPPPLPPLNRARENREKADVGAPESQDDAPPAFARRPRTGVTYVVGARSSNPEMVAIRRPLSSSSSMVSVGATAAKRPRAFRGIVWPATDLAIDALVAAFIEANS